MGTCFQREGLTPVPGCLGDGLPGYDYCIAPPLIDFGTSPAASELPLGLCEGDCDSNSDCEEGLICFQRDGLTPVPGCLGDGLPDYDYCIAPPALIDFGANPAASELPLGLCEGDCDTDNECEG